MSEQYLVDSKGLFGVAEFHRVVDKHSWDMFVLVARATLDGTPYPDLPKERIKSATPLTTSQAQMVVVANTLISRLAAAGTVPDAHDWKSHQLNHSYGLPNGRTWYGAYIPVGFTSTLSFQARNKNISTVCNDWGMQSVEDIFVACPSLLELMKQWTIPYDPQNIKKIRAAAQKTAKGEWRIETYDSVRQLAHGEGFALFLTHQNLYYTGRNKNSPSLCGALMYPSVAAAERAMKSATISNYVVVKTQLEAVEVVARGMDAKTQSDLDGAMALQQSKRLNAVVSMPQDTSLKRKL